MMNKWRWDPASLSSHFTLWLTSGYTQLRCNTLQAFTPMKCVHLRARIRASVWGGRDLFIFICDCDVVSVYEDMLCEKDRINVMLMTPVQIDHDMTWNTVYIVSFFLFWPKWFRQDEYWLRLGTKSRDWYITLYNGYSYVITCPCWGSS